MAASKEGGFKMSLGGLKGKLGLKAAPAQKEAKRPRLALGDEEEDDLIKQQEISGWDTAEGGAVDAGGKKEKETPRVIPALPNRNWRDDARRRQLAKAPHTQAQNVVVTKQAEAPKMEYGLTILKKEDSEVNGADDGAAPDEPAEPMEDVKDTMTEEQRLEKKALDALINGKSTDDDLVIPVYTEEESFRNDLRDAPDAPTLDAYAATPIEGFGAALLRGMGWKDGEAVGKNGTTAKPNEIKRRPALLGIGAKESAATGVEVGDFKGGRGKGKKEAQSFNPVALRNKHTGEILTEEELKAKIEQQNMVQEEPKKESRRHSDDEDDAERRREKRREKDDRHRDRRRDDEYDSERTMNTIANAERRSAGTEATTTTVSGGGTSKGIAVAAQASTVGTRCAIGTAAVVETRKEIVTAETGVESLTIGESVGEIMRTSGITGRGDISRMKSSC
ncbi:DExH-box splicing factor binding site-domain-containing protein [Ampelomyces quisqualis]|uniref:Pre-mRNA-splicing factor n=1 Tax=Ampelomyces quisqualis TaxID=50730 RepID=A0A6A5QHU0_AMPQU|nr:DExH-box splicing factor binding site-domain-containing protein [Ampelomyces quisqualis]